jgi:hypothetical protein
MVAASAQPSPSPASTAVPPHEVSLSEEEAYGAGRETWNRQFEGALRTESPSSSVGSITSRSRSSSDASRMRKADLAEKLKEVFGFETAEKVLAGT